MLWIFNIFLIDIKKTSNYFKPHNHYHHLYQYPMSHFSRGGEFQKPGMKKIKQYRNMRQNTVLKKMGCTHIHSPFKPTIFSALPQQPLASLHLVLVKGAIPGSVNSIFNSILIFTWYLYSTVLKSNATHYTIPHCWDTSLQP